jgi:hypothetical protein
MAHIGLSIFEALPNTLLMSFLARFRFLAPLTRCKPLSICPFVLEPNPLNDASVNVGAIAMSSLQVQRLYALWQWQSVCFLSVLPLESLFRC